MCLWCTGITACVPGTASGSEVVESFHRPWEQDIKAMGNASNVKVVLHRMQALHTKWGREDRLRFPEDVWFGPPEIGNAVLSPQIMRALHRFKPEVYYRHRDLPNFRESVSGVCVPLLLAAADATKQLQMDTVFAFRQMLDLAHQPLVEHLRAMDTIAVGGELVADVFTRTFSALEVVFLQPGNLAQAAGCQITCTCQTFGLETHCERVAFAESLNLNCRVASRHLGPTLKAKPRVRRRGPVTARGKAKAANSTHARGETAGQHAWISLRKWVPLPVYASGKGRVKFRINVTVTIGMRSPLPGRDLCIHPDRLLLQFWWKMTPWFQEQLKSCQWKCKPAH